jgi:hypothetical protein
MPILKAEEFLDLFYNCLKGQTKYFEAYHEAEEIHIKMFGCRRYKNYETFKKIKNRKA